MKAVWLILLLICNSWAQWDPDSLINELEDPEESTLEAALIEQILANWDRLGLSDREGVLRQRLSYHPSSRNWRILNKTAIHTPYLKLFALLEQDPGESRLSDHSVISLHSNQIPGLSNVIIGDFHTRWGVGFLPAQSTRRWSLATGSLVSHATFVTRPHFSTGETDFQRGLAVDREVGSLRISGFYSRRTLLGRWVQGQFTPDADGIHDPRLEYESFKSIETGIAAGYFKNGSHLYLASISGSGQPLFRQWEWGLALNPLSAQRIQVSGDGLGNMLIGWSYLEKNIRLSAQYRWYRFLESGASNSMMTFLPSDYSREQGLSIRGRLRLAQGVNLRFGTDQSYITQPEFAGQVGNFLRHDLQLAWKRSRGSFKIDYSTRKNDFTIPASPWVTQQLPQKFNKMGIAWKQRIAENSSYQVNLKSATNRTGLAWLVQQRLSWKTALWKIHIGYARYAVNDYELRLSGYETSPLESFGFFTAFDDGQRWFVYGQYHSGPIILELKCVQIQSFLPEFASQQLGGSCQLSIVL